MARYQENDLHIDQLLTNVGIGYSNPDYISDSIFPIVTTTKRSDKYVTYDQSHWFRNEAKRRQPGTKSERGGWEYSNDSFYCERYSYGHEIYDEDRDNADAQFNLDRDGAEFATDKVLMEREVAFATNFFATSVWGQDKVAGTDFTAWSDYANSDPLGDMSTWMDSIEAKIGREPTKLVVGKQVWSKIKWHPDLVDLVKYTQRGQLTSDLVASLFEVGNITIGRAIYTTSPEGTAEASVSYSRIWGKHALLLYVPQSPSLRTPAAGYTFTWQRVPNSMLYVKRMYEEDRETTVIEANGYYDHKATGTNAALFAQNVVA